MAATDGATGREPGPGGPRTGPIYDWSMRTIVEGDLDSFCDWIGIPVHGPHEKLSAEPSSSVGRA